MYVVTTGIIGNLPSVAAMDIHYGRAAVFTPSDFEFARDGIQAEADSNVEMLLVTDLDVNDLYRSRLRQCPTPPRPPPRLVRIPNHPAATLDRTDRTSSLLRPNKRRRRVTRGDP